ncbi:MAG: hypothetical protein Q8M92_01775, partial [Candidatus Subteraquimicrobiales bacterium]|nr:hypothetical protein [Candidatus Subteraquimicrobiales bacterium]
MNLISNERSFLDYLDKATAEMRNLNEEIKDCFACHLRSPSVEPLCGAGYPLADIFLLKSFPDEEEKDKKVAFAGRIGEVFYKAFERLNIDVSTVYGTNVLKCQPANEDL